MVTRSVATRSIVTSQPDVACDVCGRRLLRGELPNRFLSGGQSRLVCELCAPRAAHEGWLRENDSHPIAPRAPRGQRGRTLLDRLRQLREPSKRVLPTQQGPGIEFQTDPEPGLYDFLDSSSQSASTELGVLLEDPPARSDYELDPSVDRPDDDLAEVPALSVSTNAELKAARAIEVFNAGQLPRRIAGVARSLGDPSVNARPVAESGSKVAIVVAWELCWYRYEVDLGDEAAGAYLITQGSELEELQEQDRAGNAVADEHGRLTLLTA
jgi:hypothetical protein